jgi:serpin B
MGEMEMQSQRKQRQTRTAVAAVCPRRSTHLRPLILAALRKSLISGGIAGFSSIWEKGDRKIKITKRTHFQFLDLPANKGDYQPQPPNGEKNEPIFAINTGCKSLPARRAIRRDCHRWRNADTRIEVMRKFLFVLLPMIPLFGRSAPSPTNSMAASAINAIGIDLLRLTGGADANALLSPYSIETALAMTYEGADGATRDEMARVLHLRGDGAQVADAFALLQANIDVVVQRSVQRADAMKKYGATSDPITLDVANRLFGEKDYDFRPAFLDLLKTKFQAPFQPMDFKHNTAGAAKMINNWVVDKTNKRIKDLVPADALNDLTRLVLVNAIYLKAPWADPFSEGATHPLPFHVAGGAATDVPTMYIQKSFGYAKAGGVTVVRVPSSGGELQFLIILPDDVKGLEKVEAGLTTDHLAGWANLPNQEVRLFLPKFKMQPPTLPLSEALQKLGMTTAFDKPLGSANFDRMAPRRPNDYLYISDVFHKTFISVDEKGTEAAAATAVAMRAAGMMRPPSQPIEVKVDHPFLFAIQHRASGVCLFLGHVADPR